MIKQLLAAAAALALAAPIAAQADVLPSYAAVQNDQQIQGRIAAFDGAYNLQVRDNRGFIDNVELHDGTVINPTGLTLAPGMIVNILGYNAGNAFDANEIDTPYQLDASIPYFAGHPWTYYGPTVSLGFFFGNTGWWHNPGWAGYGGFNRVGFVRNTTIVDNTTIVNRVIDRNQTTAGRREPARVDTPVRRDAPANAAPAQHFAPPARVAPVQANRFAAAAPAREFHAAQDHRDR
jgi:opacity protein-like surface antigen